MKNPAVWIETADPTADQMLLMLQMVRIIKQPGTLVSFPSSPSSQSCSARNPQCCVWMASTGSKDVHVGLSWIGAWTMRW